MSILSKNNSKVNKNKCFLQFGPSPLESCQLNINESECIKNYRKISKRSETSPAPDMSGPAVMYMPLGGAQPPGCPSIGESWSAPRRTISALQIFF